MATILLSAAGAAIGGSIGGTVAGLSTAVIGRAVGATLGSVIDRKLLDQRVMGGGSEVVETGKMDRFRLTETGEGAPVATVYGRMRVGGQVIWASDFLETTTTTVSETGGGGGGGKGAPRQPTVTTTTTSHSYSISLAIAVGAGEIAGVTRVWADGEEIPYADLNMRVYRGTATQLPDPLIEAIEGAGTVPAYRGTAYVVIEDLQLERFGNRVPQFSFEVVRPEQKGLPDYSERLPKIVKGVALMPGTGEYSLATTQVNYSNGPGSHWAANSNAPSGKTDFLTSMDQLETELPGVGAASLIVSWFGSDLRCNTCQIRPKVERANVDGANMPWRVAGQTRATAPEIARVDGRPIYGGTPADAAVVEAIRHLKTSGKRVMFYPFILMEQLEGNGLPDPWSDADSQPHLPWRGRITLSVAPGRSGSPDGTATADAQVASFFGTASASDFQVGDGVVTYNGPDEWGLRRFILHYAALCAAAGGVSAFCISSEMRSLTQIRGASGFPAVAQLRALAAEVRALLGPQTRIGYAADWSEYFGYQPQDGSNDRYFHLDPLWADDNIDFVGIDNYMPLSDWRDGDEHLDAKSGAESIYDLSYLRGNIEGGEGYDWYYHSQEAADAQIRTPIEDREHGEHWIWRYKDLRNWWSKTHHERIGGIRQPDPTAWVPRSKPIWFTELGCAAIDKGTNQPNKFLDPKSSESTLPKYSDGSRDDLIQAQYLKAVLGYWDDPENNPVSPLYGGRMIDMSNAYVWAWDARPFPDFPNRRGLWSDGVNQARGHWLNGRSGSRSLASVVTEICHRSGVTALDVSQLWGTVRGYAVEDVSDARSQLQPLMLRYGFDAIERDGVLQFRMRDGRRETVLEPDQFARSTEMEGTVEYRREAEAEMTGRVRLRFVQSDADHDIVAEEAVLGDTETHAVAGNEMPLSMTRAEGRQTVERWLSEARVSRETARFALPPSLMALGAGDVVRLPGADGAAGQLYRIDRIEQAEMQIAEAVRIEPNVYQPVDIPLDQVSVKPFVAPTPVLPVFLDLPLITGDEAPHAPYLAVSAEPWPGTVAVYRSDNDEDYALGEIIAERAVIGFTETALPRASAGLWDEGPALQVKLISGALESRTRDAVLNGANLAAIGDGTPGNWELFQFSVADLVAPEVYALSGRLRGQLGSDALMPDVWPAGSMFVLLDARVVQTGLTRSERRVAKHYRIGPARRGYDDPSYTHLIEAFDGNGLRPYSPVHLTAKTDASGTVFSWVRRTRIDGDGWGGLDVPLGEESETYLLRVRQGGSILREVALAAPNWTYAASAQAADGIVGAYEVEVAQVSAAYGPGPFASVAVG
ncbi:host specificity protein [Ruegeria marisrubri]|uniref:Host specificity protein n=1 Tax=Ruegeria marisrubri TaxID=1685379 RepID=A0A0X3U1I8_9RHOB|nr:glycoside hydrolase/phage tail family protein [Ruegeria marisrubri]KUJ80756.1 host specificity protein [Ruegeria marisrubri]